MTIEHLKKELDKNISECVRFEKQSARKGNYTDAIKLTGMIDAYKRIRRIIEKQ